MTTKALNKKTKHISKKDVLTVPNHIAIIPDGNRRWIKQNKVKLHMGYSLGIKKSIDISISAKKYGVKILTIWALSTENITNRTKIELNLLYTLYTRTANDEKILQILKQNKACVKIIGNLSSLPISLRNALYLLQNKTKSYKELTINLLIGYGGRDDIKYLIKTIKNKIAKGYSINLDNIGDYLRTSMIPDVDLIIRTSGEIRLSGFLPWQSNYAELYFIKKNWPDFNEKDLKKAIQTYSQRQRRFGK